MKMKLTIGNGISDKFSFPEGSPTRNVARRTCEAQGSVETNLDRERTRDSVGTPSKYCKPQHHHYTQTGRCLPRAYTCDAKIYVTRTVLYTEAALGTQPSSWCRESPPSHAAASDSQIRQQRLLFSTLDLDLHRRRHRQPAICSVSVTTPLVLALTPTMFPTNPTDGRCSWSLLLDVQFPSDILQ